MPILWLELNALSSSLGFGSVCWLLMLFCCRLLKFGRENWTVESWYSRSIRYIINN